ncbi:hypothetical protein [Slackia exigua]|uniref:hypothetical protein n=1 Tax=Slackia exigua TaxID=84109 RepID=UPI002004359D|nr:hypothetical protein [Slackia exigua]MCK6139727.1 ribbon-helix-helix protein, CopG family [Slackia exigua]
MSIDNIITCRIDDDDLARLNKVSEDLDVSRSQAIRYLLQLPFEVREALDGEVAAFVVDRLAMARLERQVKRLGYQMNQMNHALNTIAMYHRRGKDMDYDDEESILRELDVKAECLQAFSDEITEKLDRVIEASDIFEYRKFRKKPGRPRKSENRQP